MVKVKHKILQPVLKGSRLEVLLRHVGPRESEVKSALVNSTRLEPPPPILDSQSTWTWEEYVGSYSSALSLFSLSLSLDVCERCMKRRGKGIEESKNLSR